MALILASQSPRRKQLLALLTPCFTVCEAGVDEQGFSAGSPAGQAKILAKAKAAAVSLTHPSDVVLGCDTVVEIGGKTLGKPATPAEAAAMLRALSGQSHLVHTGVCLFMPGQKEAAAWFAETSRVTFAALSDAEISAYIATGEPFDKAGGYGVQGAAARFVTRIEGCYFNVMGLPVSALYQAFKGLGLLDGQGSWAAD